MNYKKLHKNMGYYFKQHYTKENLKFFIFENTDRWIIDTIFNNFNYKNLDTVLDIGAHIGSFSIKAASLGAMVFALEPDIMNFNLLKRNIKINDFKSLIRPIHTALSNHNGLDVLTYKSDFNSGQRSMLYSDNYENQEIITTVTLATLFDTILKDLDRISCMKMDIEGKEFDILMDKNNKKYITKFDYIDIDIHSLNNKDYFVNPNNYRSNNLINYIKKCGFEIIKSKRTSGKMFDNNIEDGNFIFRNKKRYFKNGFGQNEL